MGAWVEHQFGGPWPEDEVLLCQGDSSSASGWITRLNVGDKWPNHLAIARTMTKYMSDHRLHHYLQWFPGKENSVADVLSRYFWLMDEDVVNFLKQNFAHQIPQGFDSFSNLAFGGNRYGRWLAAAAAAQDSALTVETRTQRDRTWMRYQRFLREIGHQHDFFLLELQPDERTEVLTCFAAAIREGWTGEADDRKPCGSTKRSGRPHGFSIGRKAGTVRAAIDGVAQAYRAYKLRSPAHDSRG